MKNGWITSSYYGDKTHYVDDKVHNDNGPAIIDAIGSKFWCKLGKYHREDGPAIEYANGTKSWWCENKEIGCSFYGYTQEQFDKWLKFKVFW